MTRPKSNSATTPELEPVFELSNEHRRCLGLSSVEPHYESLVVTTPYHGSMKVYHCAGRMHKCLRFSQDAQQINYVEHDADLSIDPERRTWSRPGASGKAKPLTRSSVPGSTGFTLVMNAYPEERVALLHCEHARNQRRLVASGSIPFEKVDDVRRWLDDLVLRADARHFEHLANVAAAKRCRYGPWRPGDIVAIEVADATWLFLRLLVPLKYLEQRGLVPEGEAPAPLHPWRHLTADFWWAHLLLVPTHQPDWPLEQLLAAERLPGAYLAQPRFDNGRYHVVGNARVQGDELDLPASLHRDGFGYGFAWGLAYYGLALDAIDDLGLPPAGGWYIPHYDLPAIATQLREYPEHPVRSPHGRHASAREPDADQRAMLFEALGLPADIEYDVLCRRRGLPDREALATLLNSVPAPGLRAR